jgi:predicted peptidase
MTRLIRCMLALVGIASSGCEDVPQGGNPPLSVPVESRTTGFIHKIYRGPDRVESKYVVFVPHDYDGKSSAPAILFLHGAGQVGKNGLDQIDGGLGEAIRKREQTFPFITIFPQAQEGSWSADSPDGIRAMVILDEVQKAYRVDAQRTYLTGYSMGGEGTWSLAAVHPSRWAAIVPLCPSENRSAATKLKHIPCWCFQGDRDGIDTLNATRRMVQAIQSAGGRVIFVEYPGVGHNCWDLAYADPDLWEWLLQQKRTDNVLVCEQLRSENL